MKGVCMYKLLLSQMVPPMLPPIFSSDKYCHALYHHCCMTVRQRTLVRWDELCALADCCWTPRSDWSLPTHLVPPRLLCRTRGVKMSSQLIVSFTLSVSRVSTTLLTILQAFQQSLSIATTVSMQLRGTLTTYEPMPVTQQTNKKTQLNVTLFMCQSISTTHVLAVLVQAYALSC